MKIIQVGTNLKMRIKMKLNRIFKSLFAVAVIATLATACQDDIVRTDDLLAESAGNKVSTAEPTITGVYDYADFMKSETPSPCVEAQMGQDLVVVGENLQGLRSLSIKGLEVDAVDYYAEWDKIVLRIPKRLPAADAANVLVCTTALGSAEYSIDLAIPSIEISNVSNEFQLPGGRTYVNGDYLSLCEFDNGVSKIYIENSDASYKEEVKVTIITDTSVTIIIPEDAPDNSLFTFEIAGEALPQKFHYRPTNLLMTPDVDTEMIPAAGADFSTIVNGEVEDDIENIFGEVTKYYRFKGDIPQGKPLTVFFITSEFPLDEGKEASDYQLVYEVLTQVGNPIPVGNTYKFMVNDKGVNMWEDYSKVAIDTNGEWTTQRIDYKSVKNNLTAAGNKHKFNIKAVGAVPKADHAFANFRIEPIIK